jgi:carbon-monoxide dehydrogenase large subunit
MTTSAHAADHALGRMETGARYVGESVLRVEDRPLLVGGGRFVDDVDRPGQLWARVVRSEVAHGHIAEIDTAAARAQPGVVDVVTAADLERDVRIPIRLVPTPAVSRTLQPPLARGDVHYVGEPIAVVVATDPYAAEDAADQVALTVEPRPAAVEMADALAPGAPALQPAVPDNVLDVLRGGDGDVDEAFAAADIVLRRTFGVQRHTAVPLETRGLVAELGDDGRLTVWGPAKVKHHNRVILSDLLDLPPERIRFVEPDVGGGFGPRGEFYPEDFLVPWLAVRLGRPVKWIEDRREHLVACNHSREQTCDLEVAAAADGTLLGFRARVRVDMGAYARTHGMVLAKNTISHLPGAYRWQAFEVEAAGIVTPKTPVGTYRGPGQVEPAFHRERMIDLVAARAGLDPAELRRRNLIAATSIPCEVPLGETEEPIVFESGDFPRILDALLERADYDRLLDEVRRRREDGELVGVGLSTYTEVGGRGPYEWARVVPATDGSFDVLVGIASVGQGIRTGLAQIAAEGLGVPIQRVRVSHHDTDTVPEGLGTFSSRSMIFGGNAVVGAVADLRGGGTAAAARALGVPEDRIEIVAGAIARDRDSVERSVSIADLGCEGRFRFEKHGRAHSMGAALVVARVDPETAGVALERCIVACDVGRMINPLVVDGQIAGAAAQGVGGALLEELAYGADGQPLSTSFMDYCLPTAAEVPPIESEVLESLRDRPKASNPLGAKGVGEIGIVGVPAAVANAVAAAIGADDGLLELPLTPDAVEAALGARGGGVR